MGARYVDGRRRREVGFKLECDGEAGGMVEARCDKDMRFLSPSSACGSRRLAIELRRAVASGRGEAAAIADGDGGGAGVGFEAGAIEDMVRGVGHG